MDITTHKHLFIVARILVLLAISSTLTNTAYAESFYTAYVPVSSSDNKAFKKGASAAFLQLLMKSTGKSKLDLLTHNSIKTEVERAHKFVQQFSYEKDTASINNAQFLVATFSKQNIGNLLQDANLKMLLDQRPRIAVIAVTQYGGRLRVLKPGTTVLDADYNDLLRVANINGVSSESISSKTLKTLSPKKLWYFNQQYIETVAKQLNVDNIVVIRLAHVSNGRWVGGSTFKQYGAENNTAFNTQELNGRTFPSALSPLFKKINQYWLEQYAVRLTRSQNEVVLKINAVDTFSDFKKAIDELKKLSVVEHVYVLQAKSTDLTLSVALKSTPTIFIKQLNAIKGFKAIDRQDTVSGVGQIFSYRWAVQ